MDVYINKRKCNRILLITFFVGSWNNVVDSIAILLKIFLEGYVAFTEVFWCFFGQTWSLFLERLCWTPMCYSCNLVCFVTVIKCSVSLSLSLSLSLSISLSLSLSLSSLSLSLSLSWDFISTKETYLLPSVFVSWRLNGELSFGAICVPH